MSYADYMFVIHCENIIMNGVSDDGFEVRPKWKDGTPAHTKKQLYVSTHYNLETNAIPMITLRKQAFKSAVDEILWIYQKQTNKLSELNSHVWDSWDVGDGTIGKAYGYQIGVLNKHHQYKSQDYNELNSGFYGNFKIDPRDNYVYLNQIGAVLWDLKHDPGSRRIMTNTYNHADLCEMGLAPCAYSVIFNVTKKCGETYLNALLLQRSQDMLAANGWNVMQYAALVQMLAFVCGMRPGMLEHMVADMHIYDRHIPIVQEMIDTFREHTGGERFNMNDIPYKNPSLWINTDVRSFFEFKPDDLKLIDYRYCEFNHKIGNGSDCDVEVAI